MLMRLFRSFRWFIRYYKRPYLVALLFVVINYGLSLVPPWMVGRIADGLAFQTLDPGGFLRLILLLLLPIVALYIVNYVWNIRLLKGGDVISRVTRRRLMEKFRRQGPIFYAQHSIGSLLGKATNDVLALADVAGYGVMALCDALIHPLAIILIMGLQISWSMTLLAIIPLPLIMVFSLLLGRRLYPLYDRAQESFDEMNDVVLDNVAGVRVVRAYGREQQQIERFKKASEDLYRKNMSVVRYRILIPIVSKFLPGFSYAIALGLGAWGIRTGQLTVGQTVSFIIYVDMLIWPMFALGDFINVGHMGLASMERIQELLDAPLDVEDARDALEFPKSAPIEFRSYSFSYPGSARPVLCDLSFRLEPGQTLGVVGSIGSGKSTLLKQLLRFYPLEEEEGILLDGQPLQRYRIASLRAGIGYCPQNAVLFSRTIRENILLGASADGANEAERLEAVLDLADLRKDLEQLPNGLDTMAGEKGIALSGGQKQRICIARALFKDPDILILDDALSAVDTETEAAILNRLRLDRAGKTTLISAHRLSCVLSADLILVMEDGRIVAQGSHETLLNDNPWYREQCCHQQAEGRSDHGV